MKSGYMWLSPTCMSLKSQGYEYPKEHIQREAAQGWEEEESAEDTG